MQTRSISGMPRMIQIKIRLAFFTTFALLMLQKDSKRPSGIANSKVRKKSRQVSPKPPKSSSVICQKSIFKKILSSVTISFSNFQPSPQREEG